MFALSPVADALTCAGEIEPAHSSATFDDPAEHSSPSDVAHGACAHGHCHHGAKAPSDRPEARVASLRSVEHARAFDDMRTAHAPEGLKRPPRG
ncbi:MAG: hypothetical protein EON88_21280 [Brevundimonas sp.]|nr:MAG: hypothetical protein EON88_21280 [Brevundimonas sp.]